DRPARRPRLRQPELRLVCRALPAVCLHRPHRDRERLPSPRPGPPLLLRRAQLRRSARAPAHLRGVPGTARRRGGAVPRHLRLPGSRPAEDGRRWPAGQPAGQGSAQLRLRARYLARAWRPARCPVAGRTRATGRCCRCQPAPPRRRAAFMSARMESTDACDLRFGQVGIACVRVRRVDAAALCDELERRVRAAPQMFARAAVVLDLSHLSSLPDDGAVDALLEAVRSAGMLPVGLAYGTSETEALAKRMGLPLIAKFRAAYEPA